MISTLGSKVAIEPMFDPEMIGSLYVPDMAKERCDQGTVKYIGADVDFLKPGDHVLFSGYSGTLVRLEGEGLLIIMPEKFITCIIYDDPTLVDGLFFRSVAGEYIPANYEQITQLSARALEINNKVRSGKNKKIEARPKPEDYDEL